jgi:hypothetical protein
LKTCVDCKIEKPFEEFPRRGDSKDGYRNSCKPCRKSYYAKNYSTKREEKRAKQAVYRENNRKKLAKSSNNYYHTNREEVLNRLNTKRNNNREEYRNYMNTYRNTNKDKIRMYNANYRAIKLKATPNWLTEEDHKWIQWIYTQAMRLSEYTGIPHHVDHIHPLRGKNICGLHTPKNLQILTADENRRKNNRF